MCQYKLLLDDNKYSKWDLRDAISLKPAIIDDFDPSKYKLFNFDVFSFEDGKTKIQHSIIRNMPIIAGILHLTSGKTYGKVKNKFLVKCIPDDKRIIPFLVPYSEKTIGFYKSSKNKYVTFKYVHWDDKHPRGVLHSVIGNVDELNNFYEYQLYCKSLHASIQDFTKVAKQKMSSLSISELTERIDKMYSPVDRTDDIWEIYTIDPKFSKDFDDAFGIKKINDTQSILSIYITNVAIWMNAMELWDSFSERISTIYLPDRRRPMLPTIMSEFLCSLLEGEIRYAFTLDILLDNETCEVLEHKFVNTKIKVKKNFIYKDDLSHIESINDIKRIFKKMKNTYSFLDDVKDNHDLIAYMMRFMNYISAKEFMKYSCGVFRSMKMNNDFQTPDYLPTDIQVFLKIWRSNGSKYIRYEEEKVHEMMKLNEYVHITSPIRRLVDLLNILDLQNNLGMMKYTEQSKKFHEYWTSVEKMDYINQTMCSIRKIQNECNLLTMCVNDPEVLNNEYDGYIFDIMSRNDGLYQYVVFIKDLKMINKFISYRKLEKFSKYPFRLYLFTDEDSLKQKVRYEIQL